MKSKYKYSFIIVIFVLFIFVLSACTSTGTENDDLIRTQDLRLEIAGNGGVLLDSLYHDSPVFISSSTTRKPRLNSDVELTAYPYPENNFLFWVGDYKELEKKAEQTISMDEDKELIAVFENLDILYMAGNINHAWGHNNVIGYWKAIIGHDELEGEAFKDGTLELYARETIGRERNYLKVSDKEVITGTISAGEIAYEGPQTADTSPAEFEYIAAIMRVEESIDDEMLVFAYAEYEEQQQIEIVILPFAYYEVYEDTLDKYDENDYTPFKDKVIEIIRSYENHEDADYLSGKTIEVLDPF